MGFVQQSPEDADAVATWLEIAFTKSANFKHENEYRLLLINPDKPGALDQTAGTIVIDADEGIASAIKQSDYY